jgi:charged multivesicular body protein 2A
MMQAMKGATGVLGSMNRSMNLPALQRIAMEFEKENDIMDQRQEMMDDAIDDVTGLEDEAEGEEVVEQVLEEIGIDLKNAVSWKRSVILKEKILIFLVDGRNSSGSSKPGGCRGQSCTGYWWWWGRR